MTFLATGLQGHDRIGGARSLDRAPAGPLASLRRGVREAFAYAAAGRVENRLTPGLDLIRQLRADGTIDRLGVGLSVLNASGHTLEYELTAMQMTVEGRLGAASPLCALRGKVAPGRTALLAQHMAAIAPFGAGATLQGSFEFALRYGVRGARRHRLTASCAMAIKSASASEIAAFTWYPI
jgi:hypothetical protein